VVLMLASKNTALQRSGRADEAYGNLMRKAGVIKRREDTDPLTRPIQDVDARQNPESDNLRKRLGLGMSVCVGAGPPTPQEGLLLGFLSACV
jgi:hypothetical protein